MQTVEPMGEGIYPVHHAPHSHICVADRLIIFRLGREGSLVVQTAAGPMSLEEGGGIVRGVQVLSYRWRNALYRFR